MLAKLRSKLGYVKEEIYVVWNKNIMGLALDTYQEVVDYEFVHGSVSSNVRTSNIEELMQAIYNETNIELSYALASDVGKYYEEVEERFHAEQNLSVD